MIITALRLRNIKSFVDAELQFSRGINIIAGANGAGKSTVIESIGLTLFDAWPQKFRDGNARTGFLRNGTKEGGIEVDIQRGEARFTVRCALGSRTRAGRVSIDYERTLLDARGTEIASSAGRKKEFQDDVRTHILGAARIDDDRLFRDIIGTEQGAFDDPFTRAESERKSLFEKILGIEDFQDFEKQFRSLVKMQRDEAGTLEVRAEENAGVPDELAQARDELAVREARAKESAAALKERSAEVAKTRTVVEKLSAQRDALAKAETEAASLEEKLRGEEKARDGAVERVAEARAAAEAVRSALPGHEAFAGAEKEIERVRASAKERDAARQRLDAQRAQYEQMKTKLQTQRESATRRRDELRGDIEEAEADLTRRDEDIAHLRKEYQELSDRKKTLDARAALAEDTRSYVQDLNTVQQTLDNAEQSMRLLRETLDGLRARISETDASLAFFPDLDAESARFFDHHIGAEAAVAAESPFATLLESARAAAESARDEAKQAADACSRKSEEGKSARRQRDEKDAEITKLRGALKEQEKAITAAGDELATMETAWEKESAELNDTLARHAGLDERIAQLEGTLALHRPAHEEYLSRKGTADTLAQREQALADAKATAEETRHARDTAVGEVKKQKESFSEEEYVAAKSALDEARSRELEASNTVTEWKTRVEEQKNTVKKLEKEVRAYERLRLQSARARREADFSSEVHSRVVRELAQHVGASIVSALSAFAADLYQRIAPEQGLALHWDPASYAVELRGEQGRVRGRELSGGQLMGVSLAVKLALIKWYAQCRVGFLDEPTTHLDRETRRHLADVIQHLEQLTGDSDPWFDQLFVISHEESFAGAGHLVELARDAEAGSRVV